MKKNYLKNVKLINLVSVGAGLTFSSALLVPFFTKHGLNQANIMVLQTIFSASAALFEVPTGYVADKMGRSMSLRYGSLAVAIGFIGYSQSNAFWQFACFEVLLGLGVSLLSGADEALLYDSLKASDQEADYKHLTARMQSIEFAAVAICAPLGSLIASKFGIEPVMLLDGLLGLVGFVAALKLSEPPLEKVDEQGRHPIRDMTSVFKYCVHGHDVLPTLMLFSAALGASTYFGFWLAPVYYKAAGIPLAVFGLFVAVRSGLKAVLSHNQKRVNARLSDKNQLYIYASFAVFAYTFLSVFVHPLAAIVFLLFDVVQALQGPVMMAKVQDLVESNVRAQVLSVMSLMRRGFYSLVGPFIGLVIDKSVRIGYLFCALFFGLIFVLLLRRLQVKKAI